MNKTIGILIIGNEILSGRTRDFNAWWLAQHLHQIGIKVRRILVIPDECDLIIKEVNAFRKMYDYVIVCGGIGPTPDDLTRPAVARAFNLPCRPHPEAVRILSGFYGDRATPRRLTMAELPENATLICNPLTGAPGFSVENVFVLPGIPELVEAMFPEIAARIEHGTIFERDLTVAIGESDFADIMDQAIALFPDVDLGSYPSMHSKQWRCTLVIKGYQSESVTRAAEWLEREIARRARDMLTL